MRKNQITLCLLLVALLASFIPIISYAHPGRTDANGGHYNRSTGEYHYHHGYPEHQHIDGICPYNYDDATSHNNSSGSKSWIISATPTPTPIIAKNFKDDTHKDINNEEKDETNIFATILGIVFVIWFTSFVVLWIFALISSVIDAVKHKTSNETKNEYKILESNHYRNLKAESDYSYYFNIYAFYSPKSFVKLPKGVYFRDGIPIAPGKGTYGLYTVYVTPTGNKYHQNPNCTNSTAVRKTHILNAKHLLPCAKCVKQKIPDIKWYTEYNKIYIIKKKYEIP